MQPIFLGLDLVALITIPVMLVLFAFAVWYGTTQCSVGIDAEEQARRQKASTRIDKTIPEKKQVA